MTDEINYKNNPLHGLGLKAMLTEIVDYYGFEILHAYLNINCFKTNPSVDSSVKFLKKTDWAREKVEAFYLYKFKNLPKAKGKQFSLPPRERIIPDHHQPGEPADLSLADAKAMHEQQQAKAAAFDRERKSAKGRGFGKGAGERGQSRAQPSRRDNDNGGSQSSAWGEPRPVERAAGKPFDPWAKAKSKSNA